MGRKIIVPMPKNLVELIDENRDELSREEFIKICIDYTLLEERREKSNHTEESFEKRMKELPWQDSFDRAWLLAFLSYGIGDVAASYIAFRQAGFFGDPLIRLLFDDNFYPVIPFKITVLLSALVLSYFLLEKKITSLFIPVFLSIAGIVFIVINILYGTGVL